MGATLTLNVNVLYPSELYYNIGNNRSLVFFLLMPENSISYLPGAFKINTDVMRIKNVFYYYDKLNSQNLKQNFLVINNSLFFMIHA